VIADGGDPLPADTAQARYRAMLRDSVAPVLRSLGFKGSGTRFHRSEGDWRLALNFQLSKWNTRDSAEFDLNIVVSHVGTGGAVELLPREVKNLAPGAYFARLSYLCGLRDFCWKVTSESSAEPLANDLIECLRNRLTPVIQALVT
jgi:hypothetical protein